MSWYNTRGPENDVVVSTRARQARNISGFSFPPMMNAAEGEKVIDTVSRALENCGFEMYRTDKISPVVQQSLIERHLISPVLIEGNFPRAVFVNGDETSAIMVNEEDHLRIQCIVAGFDAQRAFDTANSTDDYLSTRLDFAFHEKYGYLTSCPTNTGTGLRISAMLHLPAISMSGGVQSLLSQAAASGMTVRGLYGEGSGPAGNFYQLSNQITLGLSEDEILSKFLSLVNSVTEAERTLRAKMSKNLPPKLADRLLRAYGVMNHSYMISSDELIHLISDVRFGIYLGIIEPVEFEKLTELLVITAPANLSGSSEMTPEERDIKRAELVKSILKKGR